MLAYLVGDAKVQLDRDCTSGATNAPVRWNGVVLLLRYCNNSGNLTMGRGLLLWLLGIPIPVIILLYVFHVI